MTSRGCAEFDGQQIRSTVVLNPAEKSAAVVEEEDSDLQGPVVGHGSGSASSGLGAPTSLLTVCLLQIDRRCVRCNKEGMVYHTRQMRSADEGQTVFFTCVHCR